MKKLFIFTILFLIPLTFVHAYDNTTLINYYAFGNGTGSNVDEVSGKNLSSNVGWTAITGAYGSGQYCTNYNSGSAPCIIYHSSLMNFGDNSFTINYWSYSTGTTGYPLLTFGYTNEASNYKIDTLWNTTGLSEMRIYTTSFLDSPINTSFLQDIDLYEWYMTTFVYNLSDFTSKIYINGILTYSGSAWNIPSGLQNFRFNVWDGAFDELAVFNSALNSSDIEILYHNGSALNYAEVLASGNGYVNTTYEQEEITYNSFTGEYFNICIPTQLGSDVLCHHLYFNDTVGLYCPTTEQEICIINCRDTSDYWSALGQSPIDADFNGTCDSSVFECNVLGQKRCSPTVSGIETCQYTSNNNQEWLLSSNCNSDQTCVNSVCVYSGNDTYTSSVTGSMGLNGNIDDGSIFTGTSLGTRMIIFVILFLLTIGSIFVLGHKARVDGGSLGILAVSVGIIEIMSAIYFKVLPAWIGLIIAVIVGAIIYNSLKGFWSNPTG